MDISFSIRDGNGTGTNSAYSQPVPQQQKIHRLPTSFPARYLF